jgi:hypothetical protein
MAPALADLQQPLLDSSPQPAAGNVQDCRPSYVWSNDSSSEATIFLSCDLPAKSENSAILRDMTGCSECDLSQQQLKCTLVVVGSQKPCSASFEESAIMDPESLLKQTPSESRTVEVDLGDVDETQMTVLEATYTAFNWTMNNGLFSVPFVFASIGFSASGLILFIGMACTTTALLFGDVFDQVRTSGIAQPTYMDSVQAAFGKRLAGLCSVACYAELAVYVVNQVICFALTVKNMCPWWEFESLVAATCLISVLLSGLSDRAFAYTSLVSAVSMCISCVAVLVSGLEMPAWAEASKMTGASQEYPSAFCLILFGAAVHPLLPSLYEGTKSKQDYEHVVCSVWSLWGLWAILWAGAIYYMFGDAVQPMVTCNIARDLGLKRIHSLRWVDTFHSAWFTLRLQIGAPLFARPLVTCIARVLGTSLPHGNGGMLCMVLSIPVFLSLAIFARRLEHKLTWLESVSGSLLMSLNALVIPSLSYLLVCKSAPLYRRVGAGCLCALGVSLVMFPSFFRD